MANPRKPAELAEITGATVVNPGRHQDRARPIVAKVGAPYARMTEPQKVLWAEIAAEFPWLAASDRRQLRLLCKLEDEEDRLGDTFPFNKQNMIRQIYNSFGGSPSDRTRVPVVDPNALANAGAQPTNETASENDDPASEFIN